MAFILERNIRLRVIISEINYFSITKIENVLIDDPKLEQTEQLERILRVTSDEMTITPYISPSEQAILDAKAAEEERIRLALLADDFKERALMAMMNGVLEVRWEDELKKDVPIPKCMLEKEPEEFNEEDLRAVRDYEGKVSFLNSERERYKNLLDNEFTKVTVHLRDLIRRFNQKVKDVLEYKMNVDSAANQENLKINRVRWVQHGRTKKLDKDEAIQNTVKGIEETIMELRSTIASLYEIHNECQVELDIYLTKEKLLEKAFKRDVLEMTPIVQEQAIRYYRKRPKVVFRHIVSGAIFFELSRCIIAHEESLVLTEDCLEFVRALDQMDQYIGIAPVVDENTYNLICRHRRIRIEYEITVKALQTQLGDGEYTITAYEKRLAINKEKETRLNGDLQQIRTDYKRLTHNRQSQYVLRRGLVEIPLTGSFTDFKDAILIPKKEIEYVNRMIKDAGHLKIRAIMRNMGFRRNIMVREWEHRKLRMQINDLIEHINDITNVVFTKDMQQYLKGKALGRKVGQETAETELDRIATGYRLRVKDMKEKLAKLNTRIQAYTEHNDALDKAIQNINIDVCDMDLQKDDELNEKEKAAVFSRMDGLLKRGILVQQVQDNHNEILILQTELELLRLKTYPTFKYKLVDN